MNRNVESHFSNIPSLDIHRSVFDRSSGHKTTFNVGQVIPIYVDEVLPGDTFDMTTNKVVRLQTLLDPIFDQLYLDTYFFFVPNRLVWDHWKAFCGENRVSSWTPTVEYRVPSIYPPEGGFEAGSLADYFGLPTGVFWTGSSDLAPSALPFRAYALIMQEFFVDQNLTTPLYIPTGDSNQAGGKLGTLAPPLQCVAGAEPFVAAKFHDYFTSCLPSPQKHDPVKAPIDLPAIPVISLPDQHNLEAFPMIMRSSSPDASARYYLRSGSGNELILNSYTSGTPAGYTPNNLWTAPSDWSLSGDINYAAGITVNDLRIAFQLQKFYERCARGGTRYAEFIKSQFSTDVPDARVQRPEYLGGNRIVLNVHEVANTAQTDVDFLGDLGANSVTADRHSDFVHSFTEHGLIIGLAVVRYDHTYGQGFERFWMRKQLTDFFLPVFSNIGEQPVFDAEVFATAADIGSRDSVFGYQEAWADYRYKPSRVSGEMRVNHPNSFASWHLGDNYSEVPSLSDAWIREDKTNVDRVLAVSSSVSNQIFADFYFDCKCTRPMPMYSIPGLIDHN